MQALRYRTKVVGGRVRLPQLGLKSGTPVEVILLVGDSQEEAGDLLAASQSSLAFWDNPIDDQIWNDA